MTTNDIVEPATSVFDSFTSMKLRCASSCAETYTAPSIMMLRSSSQAHVLLDWYVKLKEYGSGRAWRWVESAVTVMSC